MSEDAIQYLFIFIWTFLIIIFLVIEILTSNFITLELAFGAFIALISNVLKLEWYYQMLVFSVVSAVFVVCFYPLIYKYILKKKTLKVNANSLIGKEVEIYEIKRSIGYVYLNELKWTVKLENECLDLKIGNKFIIKKIKGNRLIIGR